MQTAVHFLRGLARLNIVTRRAIGILWHFFGAIIAYISAHLLRFDFALSDLNQATMVRTGPVAIGVFLCVVVVFRLYAGLWSYFGYRDCLRYVTGIFVMAAVVVPAVFLVNGGTFVGFPRSIFILYPMLLLAWEIGGRMLFRLFIDRKRNTEEHLVELDTCLVVGSLKEVDQFIRSLQRIAPEIGKIVGIVSDERGTQHTTIHGVKVLGKLEDLGKIARAVGVDKVLILPPFDAPGQMRAIVDRCSEADVTLRFQVIPSIRDLATGKIDVGAVRNVEIEDLLNRTEVKFESELLSGFISGQTVMVTGAGGSIGSELCRQVMFYGPKKIILFENSEFALFTIERELRAKHPNAEILAIAGDIRRIEDIESAILTAGKVDIIYHAAAYKHVHLMEKNIPAALRNNVVGSANLSKVAKEMDVKHFIMISSDKAVRPTSIMGATKRVAERVLLEGGDASTRFTAVRFGNVLGSSGSVIPLFRKQIEEGGPVTVTTPKTERYFMTIPEAVQLVMMAGTVGRDRSIMVLEMGEPVKIADLARRLIELSGFKPDDDISINFIGLRPGEKEYEELLTNDENVVETEHEKIWVLEKEDKNESHVDFREVERLIDHGTEKDIRSALKRWIPENALDGNAPPVEKKRQSPTYGGRVRVGSEQVAKRV